MLFSETYNGLFNSIYFLLAVGWGEQCWVVVCSNCSDPHYMHMIVTGPAILIAVLSAGIFHNDYGIYDDNQRKVLVI